VPTLRADALGFVDAATGTPGIQAWGPRPTSEPIDRGEDGFGPRPDTEIIRQVFPADGAGCIHEEFGRARDVLTLFATLGVQHSILSNGLRFRIGEEWKRVPSGSAELLRLGGRIYTDRDHFKAALMELVQVLFETPQLGVAERSPVATIKDEEQSAMIFEEIGGGDLLSCGVHQDERRRLLADGQSGCARWNLPGEVGNTPDEETE